MIGIERGYRLFASCLGEVDSGVGPASVPLAKQILADYQDDPGFWLQFAETCRIHDDFPTAIAALERVEELSDQQREHLQASPELAPVLEVFEWMKLRCISEILKVQARGNPAWQDDLITVLQRCAKLSYEALGRDLVSARAHTAKQTGGGAASSAIWLRQLNRLAMNHAPGHNNDLDVLHDLAAALMGRGRFEEARQLFKQAPFCTFVASKKLAQKKLEWFPQLIEWLIHFLGDPFLAVAPFSSSGPRYVIAMVVWGDAFLDSLEQFTLPSLLAGGNLPHLRETGESRLICFTSSSGAERLRKMPVLQEIQSVVGVDVVTFPDGLTEYRDPYMLMSTMHLAGMVVAKASHAHFFFLAPDIVVADNFLKVVSQKLQQGAQVVFVPGLMLQLESFGEELARSVPANGLELSIPPEQLLDLGLRHVHPFVKQTYVHSAVKRRPSASVLLWPLARGGYLAHCFHHTPYLVSAEAMQRFDESMFFTIDGEFPLKIIRSAEELEQCVLLTDTRETNYFELSRGSRFDFPLEFDMARICRWGKLQGFIAEWLFRQRVVYDPGGTASSDPAYAESTRVVEEIQQGIRELV